MKIKKILSVLLTLCLFVNVSFAFDPYADEEVEQKSYKKLYYGIALTLLGGFLAYDGFSLEKVDVSKPSVDFLTVSHSEWVQLTGNDEEESDDKTNPRYQLRSGISVNNVSHYEGSDAADYKIYEILKADAPKDYDYKKEGYKSEYFDQYTVEPNILYNNGNVDLENITIEVRYRFEDSFIGIDKDGNVRHIDKKGRYYDDDGNVLGVVYNQGYHTAETDSQYTTETKRYEGISLKKGEQTSWQDIWEYETTSQSASTDQPKGTERYPHFYDPENQDPASNYNPGNPGLNLGKDSKILMDVRVILNKNRQYTPIYETKHKSDLEGVSGVFIGIAGLYFIIDHFFDMHKFNAYAKRHHLNLKVATASNQYKLILQKRI